LPLLPFGKYIRKINIYKSYASFIFNSSFI